MRKLNILITGAGAPGFYGTFTCLKRNFDNRMINITAVDIDSCAYGKYIADNFYIIPRPCSNTYISELLSICIKEKIDILIPQVTSELLVISQNLHTFKLNNVKVLTSNYKSIQLANNKYRIMDLASKNDIPVGNFYLAKSKEELIEYVYQLGYPEKKVVVKIPDGNGQRGIRVLSNQGESIEDFLYKKPTFSPITIENFLKIYDSIKIPELIVTEYLPGREYTVDCLLDKNNEMAFVRNRDVIRSGITYKGSFVNNSDLREISIKLSKLIGLKYIHGYQFKEDVNGIPKLLESNPRVQGTMASCYLCGCNIIYLSVKMILNEDISLNNCEPTGSFTRYWGLINEYGYI